MIWDFYSGLKLKNPMIRTRDTAFFLIWKRREFQNKGSVKFLEEKTIKNRKSGNLHEPFQEKATFTSGLNFNLDAVKRLCNSDVAMCSNFTTSQEVVSPRQLNLVCYIIIHKITLSTCILQIIVVKCLKEKLEISFHSYFLRW